MSFTHSEKHVLQCTVMMSFEFRFKYLSYIQFSPIVINCKRSNKSFKFVSSAFVLQVGAWICDAWMRQAIYFQWTKLPWAMISLCGYCFEMPEARMGRWPLLINLPERCSEWRFQWNPFMDCLPKITLPIWVDTHRFHPNPCFISPVPAQNHMRDGSN